MVGMFMGHDNRIEIIRRKAGAREAPLSFC
jgi:hypothetical protein